MKNLLYKELKLTITPFFYFLPILTGALILIPSWLYFFALLYFCFITIPNFFAMAKSENDIGFSVMMPVKKSDVVKARVISIVILELLHIVIAGIFAVINYLIYSTPSFFMEANFAFFGLIFVMYGIFNIILLPMFYRTGYKYGVPTILGNVAVVLFAAGVEFLLLLNSDISRFLKGTDTGMVAIQIALFFAGIIIFAALGYITFKRSANNFEKIDV